MNLPKKDLHQMLYWMLLCRRFEEQKMVLFRQGRLRGWLHPGLGQEAALVGACYGLEDKDFITLYHRGNEPEIMKGWTMGDLLAGHMCKNESPGAGRTPDGSHMFGDLGKGIIPSSGLMGSVLPVAAGVGLGLKMNKSGGIVLSIMGDGSTNRGDFHEGINLAAALKLPVVFVIVNNQWAISVPIERSTGGLDKLSVRAGSYGIPGVTVDGNDVLAVNQAANKAFKRARAGEGPSLLECIVHRHTGHAMSDPDHYRSDEAKAEGAKKDPVLRFKSELLSKGKLKEEEYEAMEERVAKEIKEAINFAEKECTNITPTVEDVMRGVYSAA